jgi:lipid A 3-O-deacylase
MSALSIVAVIFFAGAGLPTGTAAANTLEPPRWRPDSTFVQIGDHDTANAWTLGAQWDWHRRWQWGESMTLRGRWELSAARVRAFTHWQDDRDAWHTKIAFSPVVRLSSDRNEPFYLDAGIGAAVLYPLYVDRERTFSTVFNFEDYIAVGVLLGRERQHDLSIGVSHVSNAGWRQPNPGLTLLSLRYTLRFERPDS